MSVSTHSKSNKKYIIYSVFQKQDNYLYNSVVYHLDHKMLLKEYNKPYRELEGVYNGTAEKAFLRPYTESIKNHTFGKYNQESVLILENYKHGLYKAKLVFREGTEQDLGYFRQVAKEIAVKYSSYTIDGDNYYITTKSDTVLADELYDLNLKL